VYTKASVWKRDAVRRSGVSQRTSGVALVDSATGALRRLEHRAAVVADALPDGVLGKAKPKARGLESLPTGETVTTWTLRASTAAADDGGGYGGYGGP
jgi:hypothetical protein